MGTMISNLLPADYVELSEAELDGRIVEAKRGLGRRLVILGHHYQRDEVVKFADFRGDSLRLSRLAADRREAEYIVFCGVHFMAESADILSGDHQQVCLPDLNAGCSMADMADLDQVEVCWEDLARFPEFKFVPITYINSTAAIKGFVGRHEGAVCTSSNARKIFEWALAGETKDCSCPMNIWGGIPPTRWVSPWKKWSSGTRFGRWGDWKKTRFERRASSCGRDTAPFTSVFFPSM